MTTYRVIYVENREIKEKEVEVEKASILLPGEHVPAGSEIIQVISK